MYHCVYLYTCFIHEHALFSSAHICIPGSLSHLSSQVGTGREGEAAPHEHPTGGGLCSLSLQLGSQAGLARARCRPTQRLYDPKMHPAHKAGSVGA